MKTNYEKYVETFLIENNPETIELFNKVESTLETSKACTGVLKIFRSEFKENYYVRLSMLEHYLKETEYDKKNKINIYPCSKNKKTVAPEFLGLCYGKTTLRNILNRVEDQCEKMIRNYTTKQNKTILILTDKWDTQMFKAEYAATFLNYAHTHKILFMFLLVSEFGVSQIPFLTWDRGQYQIRSGWVLTNSCYISGNDKQNHYVALDLLMNKCEKSVYMERYGSYNKEYRYFGSNFKFDFYNREYTFEKVTIDDDAFDVITGNIPLEAIEKFVAAVSEYRTLKEQTYTDFFGGPSDSFNCFAELFFKCFNWKSIIKDPFYTRLREAYIELIKDCQLLNQTKFVPKK